jgi:hypothetical protein
MHIHDTILTILCLLCTFLYALFIYFAWSKANGFRKSIIAFMSSFIFGSFARAGQFAGWWSLEGYWFPYVLWSLFTACAFMGIFFLQADIAQKSKGD